MIKAHLKQMFSLQSKDIPKGRLLPHGQLPTRNDPNGLEWCWCSILCFDDNGESHVQGQAVTAIAEVSRHKFLDDWDVEPFLAPLNRRRRR